jgi:hypothetical protein
VTTRSLGTRPALRRAVTIGCGLMAVALTGAVAVVGPPPGLGAVAGAVSDVQQVAASTPERVLVCPAPARFADSTQVGDAQFGAAPVETATVARAGVIGVGATTPEEAPATLTGLDGQGGSPLAGTAGAAVVSLADVAGGEVLRVAAGMPVDTRVAASAGSSTAAGDLRGLAAASCAVPDIDQWIVGGSTEVGSSAQLVLQNPGRTPATVRLSVWGPGGPMVLSGGGQHLVPPGEEVVILVEAVAPEQRRLAVRVEASGGTVAAYLQHNTLDGLDPRGIEHVAPGSSPATAVAMGFTSAGEAVDDPLAPQLRVLAPGLDAGSATITVLGPDGPVRVRGGEVVDLAPGVVTDYSMGGLPAGSYTVVVDATVPVVASTVEARPGEAAPDSRSGDPQVDRAWTAAMAVAPSTPGGASDPVAEAGRDRGTVALVPGTTSVVRLGAAPGERSVDVDPSGAFHGTLRAFAEDGALLGEKAVTVPAGSTMALAAAEVAGGVEPALLTLDDAASAQGATPVWSVVASTGAPDGAPASMVSVLLPVPAATSQGTVDVRVSRTAGLPG